MEKTMIDSSVTTITLPQLVKQSATYKLFIPQNVEEKIRYLIKKYPSTEWSGVLFYNFTGSFENNDLEIHCKDFLLMDIGTSGWTEFKVGNDLASYIADNMELFDCETGLIHSHHSMGAFFSGQDIKTLNKEGNDTNCFVSLIVDTKGTYQAAITRKVRREAEVTVKNLGTSYEFFGRGDVTVENADTKVQTVSKEAIEYFMLDVNIEHVNNPLEYLDNRAEEIESKKKKFEEDSYSNLWKLPANDYIPAVPSKEKLPKEQYLFDQEEMDAGYNFIPDSVKIRRSIIQMITGSLIINGKFNLDTWIKNSMEEYYKDLFYDINEFRGWADGMIEYILNHYLSNPNIPDDVLNDTEYEDSILEALLFELEEYPSNKYIEEYKELLNKRIEWTN